VASAFGHGLCCIATEVFFANDGAVSRLRCRSKLAQKVALGLRNAPTSPNPSQQPNSCKIAFLTDRPSQSRSWETTLVLESRLLRPMEHVKERSHTEAAKRIDE